MTDRERAVVIFAKAAVRSHSDSVISHIEGVFAEVRRESVRGENLGCMSECERLGALYVRGKDEPGRAACIACADAIAARRTSLDVQVEGE